MEEVSKVRFEGENKETFDMIILKEFDYNKKKYAVLMEDNSCSCGCNDECSCEHDKKCDCNDDNCHCDDDCDCGCKKDCDEGVYILEITMDEYGNEVFKSIEDEKTFNEVANKADELLYED